MEDAGVTGRERAGRAAEAKGPSGSAGAGPTGRARAEGIQAGAARGGGTPAGATADPEAGPGTGAPASPAEGPPTLDGPGRLARLERAVREKPGAFGFFQLLRVLEHLRRERTPVGAFGDPKSEVARLAHNPSLSFPPREVDSLALDEKGPHRLTSNVLGLLGSMGVLPHPYSVHVLERRRQRDHAAGAFLDLFHHRILSLFYSAWRKGRPELALERDEEDGHLRHLLDLIGMGHEPEEALPGLQPEALAWYAGLLAGPNRSAAALEQLLSDRFGGPVHVEQFVGGWITLSSEDLCLLGEDEGEAGTLGTGAVLGGEVWDPHARVRIRMGPLDREAYDRLLPGRPDHEALRRLVRFFTGDRFEAELQLVLASGDVPGTVLGGDGPPAALSWGTWLRSRPAARDADETILTL